MSYGVNSFGIGSIGAPLAEVSGGAVSLAINDANHAHFCDTLSLSASGGTDLTTQDALHSQAAENVTLTTIPVVDYRVACIGDSNASGRLSNNQPFSGTAYLYNNAGAVVALADPWDGGTNTYTALSDGASAVGSYIPRLAQLLHNAGKSTLWVPANKGGTQTADWARSLSTATCYGAMKARIDAAGGVDIINIHLGANDASASVPQATFTTRINQLITDLRSDFPTARLVLHKIQEFSGYVSQAAAIRLGVQDVWDNNIEVEQGADFNGITTSVHYTTDADAIEVAARIYGVAFGASLDVQSATHAHIGDGVVLTLQWLLTVAKALHSHAAGNLTLGVTGAANLAIADATSAHAADNLAFSLNTLLAVFDAIHAHAADTLTLDTSNATALTVQDSTHAHGADNLGLSLDTWLAIVEAAHGHTADAPTLSTALALQIAESLHAHYADVVVLGFPIAPGSISDADITRIVQAVLAALNATTIPVNIKQVNSITIKGAGVTGNTWGPL